MPESLPSRIGGYAIVAVLGEGGMGTVYEAQQENPKRAVALKVIRAGLLSPELLRRFTQESQVLARLHHPGIAQVFEAGVAKDERGHPLPFFAMEFVRGVPLTRFAREKRLATRERLDLIARIADAVDHAHQKGVIHRDLKPGNILVDESGQPKILDFGIARARGVDFQTTLRTDVGQLIGTIPYMSPEQVGGDPEELDTRSDVYALGVIAYEVLAGRLPYDLEQKVVPEAARIIREEEPTRLSSFDRTLRGDVETIVAKALEKDKSRRYPSADSLASDIRRHLRDEPIEARPASTWYQLRKFSRRNRGLVAGVGAALVLLVAGVVATGLALRRALQAESGLTAQLTRTEAARRRAEAINAFVTKALDSSDPMQAGRQDVTVAEAMGSAVSEIEAGAFREDPETEADLLGTIGRILKNGAKYAQARPVLERALATSLRVSGEDSPAVAESLNNLAQLHEALGEDEQAERLYVRSLAIREKTLGAEDLEVATSLTCLAQLHFAHGNYEQAEPLFERSLAIREKHLAPDHREVATGLNDLALVRAAQGKHAEAEALMKRSLAIFEGTLGPDHPDVAASLNSLALLYEGQGEYAQAEPLYVRALAICEKALGPEHPLVATALHSLAELDRVIGQNAKAQPLYERALVIREKVLGPDHYDVGVVLSNMGRNCLAQDLYPQAELFFARTLAIDEKALGPDHIEVAGDLHNLAWTHEVRGQLLQAEPLYERALAIRERVLGPDHMDVAFTETNLARIRQGLGRSAQAREGFDRAIVVLRGRLPEGSATLARVLWFSAKARLESGEAAAALPELEEAVAMAEKFLPSADENLGEYRETLAKCRTALAR